MLVAEIFRSVQGEGLLAGTPSVFVRTSGCNMRCVWCDTPYASWEPTGSNLTVHAICDRVCAYNIPYVVLTGGEPMVARQIHDLAIALKRRQLHITIETAATVPPRNIVCDLASLSPKLSNSTPPVHKAGAGWAGRHERLRIQPAVIKAWQSAYPWQLKFVVSTPKDLAEIQQVLQKLNFTGPNDRVLLMPEGITADTLADRSRWLVQACIDNGYRYCPRLHIDLFGNTRGT